MTCKKHFVRVGIYLNILIVQIGFHSCDTRVSAIPVWPEQQTNLAKKEMVHPNLDATGFALIDAIHYLKIVEKSGWTEFRLETLEELLQNYNEHAEMQLLASNYFLHRRSFQRALDHSTKAEKLGAASIALYKSRAEIYAAIDEYGLAIDYINKAVLLNGSDPEIHLTKGEIYMRLGDQGSALRFKEEAFRQDSSRLDIAEDLAYLHSQFDDYSRANTYLEMLTDNGELSSRMRMLQVSNARETGEHQLANTLLKDWLEAGEVEAGNQLIDHFKSQFQPDSIIHYASMILAIDSANLTAMGAKAEVFDQKGYFASALMYYQQMLSIDSLSKEASEGLRKVNGKIAYLRKLRERREAIPTFDLSPPKKKSIN